MSVDGQKLGMGFELGFDETLQWLACALAVLFYFKTHYFKMHNYADYAA